MEKTAACVLCTDDRNILLVEMAKRKLPLCKSCAESLSLVLQSRGQALAKYVRRLAKDLR